MRMAISIMLLVLNILNLVRLFAGDKPRTEITLTLLMATLMNMLIR